jgi:hypothetical protein
MAKKTTKKAPAKKKQTRAKRKSAKPEKNQLEAGLDKIAETPEKIVEEISEGVPSSFVLLAQSVTFLFKHMKKLLGISLVMYLLYLLLIRAGSTFDIESYDQLISDELGDSELVNKALLTGILIGSGGSSETSASGVSGFLLFIVGSLAFIWGIRHLTAGKKFRIRDAYYKGMYPLIPFMLVIFVITIQLIPFVVGGFLYSTAEINGLITSGIERTLFVSGWIAMGLLSVYWLSNSVMSVYAVTLPDIYPLQALRSTKKVVKGRRWSIFIKVFMLGIFLLLFSGSLLFLFVALFPAIAVYIYDIMAVFTLLFAHIYLFKLYRSLL